MSVVCIIPRVEKYVQMGIRQNEPSDDPILSGSLFEGISKR